MIPSTMSHDVPQRPPFQAHQIVYLICDQHRLYTEVIEILSERQLAWVRPLALMTPEDVLPLSASLDWGEIPPRADQPTIPDLLWPLNQFYPALDTDFVALWAMMPTPPHKGEQVAHSAIISQFTRRLWETTQGTARRPASGAGGSEA